MSLPLKSVTLVGEDAVVVAAEMTVTPSPW